MEIAGVACSLTWALACSGSFITIKDEEFVGEDKALVAELARRIPPPPENPDFIDFSVVEPKNVDHHDDYNNWDRDLSQKETRRQYWQDPYQFQVESLAMKMMEQAVAGTQRRLIAFEPTISRYESDPRFRMAYAFKKLEEWELDLWHQWSFTENYTRLPPDYTFKIHRHIIYYTHAVKRFLDVTYTKEFILELNDNITKYNL